MRWRRKNGSVDGANQLRYKKVKYLPAILKIFDEIIMNAVDNKAREEVDKPTDPKQIMSMIKVNLDKDKGTISVENDGRGILVDKKEDGTWVPEMVFADLRAGSNFDDEQTRDWAGKNGLGATLCGIFSKKLKVDTSTIETHHKFSMVMFTNRPCFFVVVYA